MSAHEQLVQRLWRWGAWARIDPCRPDNSCQNSFWDRIDRAATTDDDGWGSTQEGHAAAVFNIVRSVTDAYTGRGEPDEIDEQEAEETDAWIRQLPREPRSLLIQRFVLRLQIGWQKVDPAIRALSDLMTANMETVRKLRRL